MSTRRRLVPALLAGATVVALLSGCVHVIAPRPSASASPTASGPFASQVLHWAPCGAGFECTTVAAPINWDAPGDGAIKLAVVKHAATGTRLGSLLVNPGGPGGSGWDFVHDSLDYAVSATLSANYDVVGWDPRGVGQSTPVTCFTDPKDTDKALYGTFSSPYGSQGWIDELTIEEKSFAAACEKNTGELLGHVDSASTAKDMDLIRGLLGEARLNYLGYSYGTFLGAIYAELFPDHVGRMVLDGAVDPTLSTLDELSAQMAGFDSAFRAYMASCLAGSGCPFTGTVDQALDEARGVLGTVDSLHLVNSDGRQLDSATLGTAIASDLYSKDYWPDLTSMLVALSNGDPSLAFTDADYYNSRNPDGTYSSNSTEVYTAVSCLDGDFVSHPTSALDGLATIDAAAPILGKYFAYDDFAVLDTACTNWPDPEATLPTSFGATGTGPILVIGTTNDPATPYAWAKSLAEQLSRGVLVSRTGEGHTAYNKGNACVDSTVDDYFVKGVVPESDPMC